MRSASLLFVMVSFFPWVASEQPAIKTDRRQEDHLPQFVSTQELQTYVIHLTEYHLDGSIDLTRSGEETLQAVQQQHKEGKARLVETIQLSALQQHESSVQFGRQVEVTTGIAYSGRSDRAVRRSMETRQVGTRVRLTAEAKGEKILLALSYAASRHDGDEKEDRPPEVITINYDTTLLLEPGVPALIGNTRSGKTSVLLIAIE